MPLTQIQFDWDDAQHKAAARERRKLLTRLKVALNGRLLGGESNPRNGVSGAAIAAVLDGLHGWCIGSSDGTTDRLPGEIAPQLSVSRIRRVLSYLRSEAAWSCVAVDPFRSHGSPRNRHAICWSNLFAWVEELEADPVPVRTRKTADREAEDQDQPTETTYAERTGHLRGTHRSTYAERTGHLRGTHRSYKEDGPEMVQMAPSMGEEGEGAENREEEFTTEARRHGPAGRDRPASQSTTRELRHVIAARGTAPGPAASSVPPCLRGDSSGQPPVLRQELERLLQDRLGVDGASACLDLALKHQTLDQVAAVIRYAVSQEIEGVRAWEPGWVFTRVSRRSPEPLQPSDGWLKPRQEWRLAKARQAERERAERAERRTRAERDLSTHRPQIEQCFGPLIDRLYAEDRERLLAGLLPGDFIHPGEKFRDRRVRDLFLIAAILGRYEDGS